jgi:hypothetical protein
MDEPSPKADELNAILRQALPESWRHAEETSLTPEGFVFRFRDAEGRQHALDARPRDLVPTALLTGEALGYSYTIVDPTIDDAAVLDTYRAVLTALAARESELLPWLPPPAAATPAEAPLPWRGPLPGERPAPSKLVAILRGELPPAWRHDLSVSLTQNGFVLQFVDEAGVRHALDAREIRPESPTLVSGRVLAFSYLFVGGGAEETALAGEYRAVLSRLAARENDLLPWLDPTAPAGGPSVTAPLSAQAAEALPDEHPAPASLVAILRAALPEAWRHAVQASLSPGGFIFRFRDAESRQHALDARELRLVPSAFVSGGALGYSYTIVDPAVDEATVIDGYRSVLTALAARESDLLPSLSLSPAEAEGRPNAVASTPSWKGPFANERPAPAELEALARGALPEAWRHDLAVSLTPGGFIVRFRDAEGRRHAFDAREARSGEPTLVSGRALAFSYLCLEEGAEETALAGEYRAALAALAARESDLLPWLSLSPEAPPPPDHSAAPPNDPLLHPAPPELAAIVREALPEAWRHDMAAVMTTGGLVARLHDPQGTRRAFDVREIRPGEPALVSGRVLAFSYLSLDGETVEVDRINEYRTVLGALAAREEDMLPWLRTTNSPTAEDPLRPNSRGFISLLTGLLPPAWRTGVDVVMGLEGFTLTFQDGAGVRHMLEARLLRSGLPALVRGQQLGFSYRKVDPALDESVMVQQYREALEAFRAHEGQLVAGVQGTA